MQSFVSDKISEAGTSTLDAHPPALLSLTTNGQHHLSFYACTRIINTFLQVLRVSCSVTGVKRNNPYVRRPLTHPTELVCKLRGCNPTPGSSLLTHRSTDNQHSALSGHPSTLLSNAEDKEKCSFQFLGHCFSPLIE